jgi:hypothetical protein
MQSSGGSGAVVLVVALVFCVGGAIIGQPDSAIEKERKRSK